MIVDKAASVNLKRKIKLNNNWAFVPVARKNGHYFPDQVLIARHLDKGKCRYVLYEVVWKWKKDPEGSRQNRPWM